MNIKFINFMKSKYLFWICYSVYGIITSVVRWLFIPNELAFPYVFIIGGIAGYFLCWRFIFKFATIDYED
jgi:hypothetical protein